jgi:hypothetical protein|tara:strand:+ start:1041 stop:1244 length:204 start_codon:yes stop_codon:yes gene_type:complete
MSNNTNTMILEKIQDDVLELFDGDVWNVIWAIEKEFGIGALPGEFTTDDCFIDCLINLRFEQLGDMA